MAGAARKIRRTFVFVHRWIAIVLFVLIVPIALSGTVLVFDDELDALLNPGRYAVSGHEMLPPSVYFAAAMPALDDGLQITGLRYPDGDGPVIVQARSGRGSGPPQVVSVYLDPPTGRVLDKLEFRSSLFGVLHRFHENLTVPEYSGRAIVGWVGVGMLFLSLSGIYIWWPRNGVFVPGLRWRRAQHCDTNLHHLFGFWISLPLALVSLTGVYLAFPLQSRAVMSSISQISTQTTRPGFGAVAQKTSLTADRAMSTASAYLPQARATALFVPMTSRGAAANEPLLWRVQFRTAGGDTVLVLVDDVTGKAAAGPESLSGDRAAQWIRWIHEGSHSGLVWRIIVAFTGFVPVLLGITGILMWLRIRRVRRGRVPTPATESLRAAE
ncbi:MAG: PepSY-associated TM helix domain-containing protein [Xanthobacteraceae bacterium]